MEYADRFSALSSDSSEDWDAGAAGDLVLRIDSDVEDQPEPKTKQVVVQEERKPSPRKSKTTRQQAQQARPRRKMEELDGTNDVHAELTITLDTKTTARDDPKVTKPREVTPPKTRDYSPGPARFREASPSTRPREVSPAPHVKWERQAAAAKPTMEEFANSGFDLSRFVNPEMPGYVGFANLPNQVHRKSVKKGFEFTLMVVGESGLGKSTLVNSLFLTDLYPERVIPGAADRVEKTVNIEASTVEIEERGVKLRLTVVDTPGFGDGINTTDCFKTVIKYIDEQFEKYLHDECGLNRRNIIDNRVHCCFYFVNPAGHGLKPLDIAFMKAVDHKVNIVPVIAKADTLTKTEVAKLKQKILDEITRYNIQIYTLPDCDADEDEEYKEQCRQLKAAVPFAVVGSNQVIEIRGRKVRGRMYPWGVVEVENPDHCDFIKLRTMLVTHMQDLQEVTQEIHYENYRSQKLAAGGGASAPPKKVNKRRGSQDIDREDKLTEKEKELAEKEVELRRMQDMLSKMQAEMHHKPQAPPGGPPGAPVNNNTIRNGQMNGHAPQKTQVKSEQV